METQQDNKFDPFDKPSYKRGRVISGLVLIGVGLVYLARQLGVEFPEWLFSWPMFFIVLGFYIGAKHSFRNPGYLILMAVGGLLLAGRIYPDLNLQDYLWPIILIGAGLVVVFKPHRHGKYYNKYKYQGVDYKEMETNSFCNNVSDTTEDYLNSINIMGGVKRNVLSKQFKGGEIVCIMGGAEINLSQADIQGEATLEIIQIMGGAKLIIPAHWEIKSEAMVILGGIEDKRPQILDRSQFTSKVLIIKGTCIFGGIDIKSY